MSKKVKIYHPEHGENACYPTEIKGYKKNGWDIKRPKSKPKSTDEN